MTATTRTPQSTDSLLRFAMRADAVISGLTGVALLLLAPRVAEWSGTTPAVGYATGAFFVVFLVRMCCLFAFCREIFPEPVFLNRLAAPL